VRFPVSSIARGKKGIQKLCMASREKYPFEDMNLLDLEGEIWKPLPDYEEYYMVSNLGRIKWLPRTIYYCDGRSLFGQF